jgi:hypothetical protein
MDPTNSLKTLIQRIIGDKADPDDFIISFNKTLNSDDLLDTFEVLNLLEILDYRLILILKIFKARNGKYETKINYHCKQF